MGFTACQTNQSKNNNNHNIPAIITHNRWSIIVWCVAWFAIFHHHYDQGSYIRLNLLKLAQVTRHHYIHLSNYNIFTLLGDSGAGGYKYKEKWETCNLNIYIWLFDGSNLSTLWINYETRRPIRPIPLAILSFPAHDICPRWSSTYNGDTPLSVE